MPDALWMFCQKRFSRYGLELHPEKTVLIPFMKPVSRVGGGKGKGTFDYLIFSGSPFFGQKACAGTG
jgi:hypothetical protein